MADPVFSLWYSPPEPLRARLAAEIARLAQQHPGSPTFPPHITLAGPVTGLSREQALERTRSLAAGLQPFPVEFERVATGTAYWQCVFLRCRDSPALQGAAARARAAFGAPGASSAPYMPHLSLLYSNITPAERRGGPSWHAIREAVAAAEQGRLLGGGEGALPETGFLVDSVSLYLTPPGDDTLSNWREVGVVPLGGGPPPC